MSKAPYTLCTLAVDAPDAVDGWLEALSCAAVSYAWPGNVPTPRHAIFGSMTAWSGYSAWLMLRVVRGY